MEGRRWTSCLTHTWRQRREGDGRAMAAVNSLSGRTSFRVTSGFRDDNAKRQRLTFWPRARERECGQKCANTPGTARRSRVCAAEARPCY